jgi:hypothetical protein
VKCSFLFDSSLSGRRNQGYLGHLKYRGRGIEREENLLGLEVLDENRALSATTRRDRGKSRTMNHVKCEGQVKSEDLSP